jgi:hypothetical protein
MVPVNFDWFGREMYENYKRGASLEEDSLIVFKYLNTSGI